MKTTWEILNKLYVGSVLESLVTTVKIQRQAYLQKSTYTKDDSTFIDFEKENLCVHPSGIGE